MRQRHIPLIWLSVVLILVLAACELPFIGSPEKTIYLGPVMVECQGEGPQMCLLVKENPDDEYTYFYDRIEGFDFEEGYEYVIKVKEESVDNPPAGGSSIKWTLVEVVSKTSAPQALNAAAFEGILWNLMAYLNSQGEVVNVLPGSEITAGFFNGQVTGYAGCNNYFGSYQIDGDRLVFSEIGSTEMACGEPEGVMQQESDYLANMEWATSYQMQEDQFKISKADGETILLFKRSKPVSLVGTDWRLNFYNDGEGAFVSVLPGTEITALFGDDGSLTGSAGCNNYNSSYQVDESDIEIGPAATTRMNCQDPEGIMEQEISYLAALESAATYQIQGDNLVMEDAEGVRVLSYSAFSEAEEVAPPPSEAVSELVGSVWKWLLFVETNNNEFVVDDPEMYTLEFLADGQVNLQADCNRAGGTYQVDGESISIEILTTTMAACPEGSRSDEFIGLLNGAAAYAIDGQFLYIDTVNPTGRMAFTKDEEISMPSTPETTSEPAPAATDTPMPTHTPSPTVAPTPTPLPNAVFEDDFTRDTGWPTSKADTYGFALKDGAYYISVKTPNGFIWSVRSLALADVTLETDAVRVEGTENGYYGVVCRYQTGTNYYALVVSDSGAYGIAKMEGVQLEFLKEGTDKSGVIHTDGQFNRVRGDCVGDTLTLYVNGQKLLEVQDSTFKDGKIGLIAVTFREKLLQVKYDNFVVYER